MHAHMHILKMALSHKDEKSLKTLWIQTVIPITTKVESSDPCTIVDISSKFHQNHVILQTE